MPNAKNAAQSRTQSTRNGNFRKIDALAGSGAPLNSNNQTNRNRPTQNGGGNAPVAKVSSFPVEAAIWLNHTQDGKPMYSVTFQRVYKAQDGSWKRTQGYAGSDLLILSQVAQGAWNRIQQLKQEDSNNIRPSQEQQGYQGVDDEVPF